MLCYRCGSHVPDTSESCPNCGQKLAGGGVRQATATFSRRRALSGVIEGSPYRAGDVVSGRYQIKDVVGSGPLGFVFRAHDKEIDVEVALKSINPRLVQTAEERRAFAKTMRAARKLSHPNLVRLYEEGEDAERPYYTLQFLDGLTLRKIIDLRLQKGQFFALREIEPIFAQVAAALDGAHKVGPHSDLKPENVLVLPDLLKVTDFGLGLAMPRLPFVQAVKSRRADRYLSPELTEGRDVDHRTDLYSMGVILGEMVAGLTPDGSLPELQRRNPEVPPQLEGLYRKACNANPSARPKTAGEFFAEFQEISRRATPPPMKPRVEQAAGTPAPVLRPRTSTGVNLQLQPRRPTGMMPAVAPPPPPPVSEEVIISSREHPPPPDSTQPVDEAKLKSALNGHVNGESASAVNGKHLPGHREETEVIQSAQYIQPEPDPEDLKETKARVAVVADPEEEAAAAPPPPAPRARPEQNRTALWLVLLTIGGVGLGAGGGYYLLQRLKGPQQTLVDEAAQKRAEEAARAALEAEKAAAEKAAAEKAALEKLAAEREAVEKEQAARLDAERAAAQKAAFDRVAAEKAALDKAAAEKALADKAAMDRAAADKAAADRAAAEKLSAEKLAAQKTPAVTPVPPVEKPAPTGGPCEDGMRLVAAGTFRFGTPRSDDMMSFDEKNQLPVDLKAFCVDQFEFPNKRGVPPTTNVAWADAKRLCEGKGKRLCTEEEWEKSCHGQGGARFPYGNAFDANACNTVDDNESARVLSPSGRFGRCRSGYGVADLSGNAAEWTAEKVQKGGSYAQPDFASRCSARKVSGSAKSPEVGFRCCADPH